MINPETLEEIRILMFEMTGIHFGIDMDQISDICEPGPNGSRYDDLFKFHEKLILNQNYKSASGSVQNIPG